MKRCILCHRPLKSEESKLRGLGPSCWAKLKKLDKEQKKKRKERLEARKFQKEIINGQVTFELEVGEIGKSRRKEKEETNS